MTLWSQILVFQVVKFENTVWVFIKYMSKINEKKNSSTSWKVAFIFADNLVNLLLFYCI